MSDTTPRRSSILSGVSSVSPARSVNARRRPLNSAREMMESPASRTNQQANKLLDRARQQHELEIIKLERSVRRLEREIADSVQKKQALEQVVTELKSSHAQAAEKSLQELAKLGEKQKGMSMKLDRIPGLERQVVDVYLEFIPDPKTQRQGAWAPPIMDREELLSQSSLTVLNYFHTNIRAMLAANEETEQRLKEQLARSNQQLTATQGSSKQKIATLEVERSAAVKEAEEVLAALAQEQAEKDETERALQSNLTELEGRCMHLEAMAKRKSSMGEHLASDVQRRDNLLRAKETRLVQVTQLEQQIAREQREHRQETNKLREENQQQIAQMEKESVVFFQARSRNNDLKKAIGSLQNQLHTSNIAIKRACVDENEKKARVS
eukprot:NODE_567_length_2097_cov_36.747070_g523_i0.p1 GENE.NODE_567_length_2097_cov_36.747070_g523_i0~~NODE_567_length_2097_cov_36.747070_g523_i0.p1  ORF type:complete len:382 (+),score=105.38 NODE_567_length_2097_cov_36.747070_g523_i0:184-1329(+)